MTITTPEKLIDPEVFVQNDDSDLHNDETGENTGEDTELAKQNKVNDQNDKDGTRVETVTPADDNGRPGAPEPAASNKNQGPANGNL